MIRALARFMSAAVLGLLMAACGKDPVRPPLADFEYWESLRTPGRHQLVTLLPSRDTIRYTLFVPPGTVAGVPLVVAAHFGGTVVPWLGGDFADVLVVPAFQELPAVILAPDAGSPGGWSPDDHEDVLWLAREVRDFYGLDPARVVITGYSAGGRQTWSLANRHQDFFRAAVPVSARPGEDAHPWEIPVYVIHSEDDELIPLADVAAYVGARQAEGADFHLTVLSGPTHYETVRFVPAVRDAVSWLAEVWP